MPFSPQLLQQHMARYGYVLVETPMIEPADLFLTKAGDQIIDRLFTFDYRGRQYALRPEFTASAASRYVHTNTHEVVRWQFNGAIFENNPENLAQNYQHHSIGAELIGLGGSSADAEIISMAALGLNPLGLEDYQIVIGHVGLTRCALERFDLDDRAMRFLLNHRVMLKEQGKDAVLAALDRYLSIQSTGELVAQAVSAETLSAMLPNRSTAMGRRSREDIARRLLEKHQRHAHRSQIIAALDFLVQWDGVQASAPIAFDQISQILDGDSQVLTLLSEWQATLDLLAAYDIPLTNILIQPDLVRNWDYYTGMVFELRVASSAGLHVVGGGGRYDDLTHLIGGTEHTPSVGFTYYADVLVNLLGDMPQTQPLPITLAENGALSIRCAQRLRQYGMNVVLVPPEQVNGMTIRVLDDEAIVVYQTIYHTHELAQLITDLELLRS